MATMYRYQLPVEQTGWTLQSETETSFTWEYEDERAKLLALYDKGKKQQWDAAVRGAWALALQPADPQQIDDPLLPLYGSAGRGRAAGQEKGRLHQRVRDAGRGAACRLRPPRAPRLLPAAQPGGAGRA